MAVVTTDIPFSDARDVTSIRYRLAPIDVGFDLREGVRLEVARAETMRASYATRAGDVRVIEGPQSEVLRRLRGHGYRFLVVTTAETA